MSIAARIERPARREHLAALLAFIDRACADAAIPSDAAFDLHLAAEEACMNVIAYGYHGGASGPLSLAFDHDEGRVTLTVEDDGAPFDPRAIAPADLTAPAEERALGGLGWHLINQVMDEVHHERIADGGNRLTLIKRLHAATNT